MIISHDIVQGTHSDTHLELSVFCEHYHTEITSIDVETGRCDRYGEEYVGDMSSSILYTD